MSVKLVLKNCLRHYGSEPGPCSKCAYYSKLRKNKDFVRGLDCHNFLVAVKS